MEGLKGPNISENDLEAQLPDCVKIRSEKDANDFAAFLAKVIEAAQKAVQIRDDTKEQMVALLKDICDCADDEDGGGDVALKMVDWAGAAENILAKLCP